MNEFKKALECTNENAKEYTKAIENALKIIKLQVIFFFALMIVFIVTCFVSNMFEIFQAYDYDDFPEPTNINNNSITND